ncbi:MAG: pyruvate formate lyase family protein, partial [Spirochaetia bacterium]|nr:pyruvate formate lyase family protein [Spirochaetia bacterium]
MSSKPLEINQMSMYADPLWVIHFTDIHRFHKKSHPAVREAECLKVQYPQTLLYPKKDDQFVGRKVYQPVGFDADMSLGYYLNQEAFVKMISREENSRILEQLKSCYEYWEREHTRMKIRTAYPDQVAKILPSDDHLEAIYPAYPLYRLAGTIPDPSPLLTQGIEKLQRNIDRSVKRVNDEHTHILYRGFSTILYILKRTCLYYAKHDRECGNISRAELLERISVRPPESTYEALQLLWL